MYKVVLMGLIVWYVPFIKSDNKAILQAMGAFDLVKLEAELIKQSSLMKNIKKEFLKVADDIIMQEAENNIWHRKYDGIARIVISIPLLCASCYYFSTIPFTKAHPWYKNIDAFFEGQAVIEDSPQTQVSVNTTLVAASGMLAGYGLAHFVQGMFKLWQDSPRYTKALAMKTLIQECPEAKCIDLSEDES